MRIDTILTGLATGLAASLATEKLTLAVGESPEWARDRLKGPMEGVVLIWPADDESDGRGVTTLDLHVVLRAGRGMTFERGADLHKQSEAGRLAFFHLFSKVVALVRSVRFTLAGGGQHGAFECHDQFKYMGSQWLIEEDPQAPVRDRMATFQLMVCLDVPSDDVTIALASDR